MDAVGYIRYSSDSQSDGYSIEAQKNAINSFASREGYSIKNFYVDEAKTGTNDNRESFLSMIDDAKKGLFKYIIVHKLDRFSRNRKDSIIYRAKLNEFGVKIISVLEKIDESIPEDVILLSMLEAMAEYYSKNLGREVRKGMTVAASKGQFVGGRVPYGYFSNRETKKLHIRDNEAKVVKDIFGKFITLGSIEQLVQYCKDKGYSTREGGPLRSKQLHSMLSNHVYIGSAVYRVFRKESVAYKGLKNRPEPIIVDNAYEPIITQSDFNLVQSMINDRKRGPYQRRSKKTGNTYLLTGKLSCINGSPMTGRSMHVVKKYKNASEGHFQYFTYHCSCGQKHTVKKEDIENFVHKSVMRDVFNEDNIISLASSLKSVYDKNEKAALVDIQSVKEKLEKTIDNQEKLLDLYLDGKLSKERFNKKNLDLEQSRLKFSNILNKSSQKFREIDLEQFKMAVRMLPKMYENEDNTKQRNMLISTFIDKVIYSEQNIEIVYRISLDEVLFKKQNGGGKVILNITYKINHLHNVILSNERGMS